MEEGLQPQLVLLDFTRGNSKHGRGQARLGRALVARSLLAAAKATALSSQSDGVDDDNDSF
jgi:hypothetical protein